MDFAMSSDLSLNGQALLKNNCNHCIKLHFFSISRAYLHRRRNYGHAFLMLLIIKFNKSSHLYIVILRFDCISFHQED